MGENERGESCGSVRRMKGDRQRLIFVPSGEQGPFGPVVDGRTVAQFFLPLMYLGGAEAAMCPILPHSIA